MNRVAELDQQITDLRSSLDSVEGTQTEVYTRIVGYYRSLKNWNRGKREEYDHRRTFTGEMRDRAPTGDDGQLRLTEFEARTATTADAAAPRVTVATLEAPAATTTSYLYFYRETCPNCPPVRKHLDGVGIDGVRVNVDTEDGRDLAIQYEILATPTVVFIDAERRPMGQAHSPAEIDRYLNE